MARNNVYLRGQTAGTRTYRVAASATRGYAGEPVMTTPTYSSGAGTNANTIKVVTDAKPRIATDEFKGILAQDMLVNASATVIAQKIPVQVPIPYVTLITAAAKTITGYLDTDADLLAILGNLIDFDLTSSVYTFDPVAASNASAFTIVNGNIVKGTLDCIVDARAMRTVIS